MAPCSETLSISQNQSQTQPASPQRPALGLITANDQTRQGGRGRPAHEPTFDVLATGAEVSDFIPIKLKSIKLS